jgi:hypothetical protein
MFNSALNIQNRSLTSDHLQLTTRLQFPTKRPTNIKIRSGCVAQPITAPNDQTTVRVSSCLETEAMAKPETPETASLQFTLT